MVFGFFDRWKFKNILAIVLALHTSFLPSAYAYDENDGYDHGNDGRFEIFDDEPFVITHGELMRGTSMAIALAQDATKER